MTKELKVESENKGMRLTSYEIWKLMFNRIDQYEYGLPGYTRGLEIDISEDLEEYYGAFNSLSDLFEF